MVGKYLTDNKKCKDMDVTGDLHKVRFKNLAGLWVVLLVALAAATLHALARRYLFPTIVNHVISFFLTAFCWHRS
jgi:hypothetical protein